MRMLINEKKERKIVYRLVIFPTVRERERERERDYGETAGLQAVPII